MSTPAHTALSVQQFLTKNGIIPMPHPPCSADLTLSNIFVSPNEKVLKGKHLADVEEVKQKMAEALKGIKIDEFQKLLSSGKKVSLGVLHQMERSLKVAKV